MADNPQAFPRTGEGFGNPNYDEPGMTLRDWFAGQAMQALVTGFLANGVPVGPTDHTGVARKAFSLADALLAQREEKL